MKSRIVFLVLSVALSTGLHSCRPSPRMMTQVSGKTVYKGMGMENVLIKVYRQEPSGWQQHADTRSGYHGSFIFNAPAGNYRLVARTDIKMGTRSVHLEGSVNSFAVQKHGGRIDRVVINLQAVP